MTELVPVDVAGGGDRLAGLTAQFLAGRKSADTRDAYRLDLSSWLAWCRDADVDPRQAWPGDITVWLASIADQAGTTRARRLSAVSSWYRWLIRHQAVERNPAILDKAERPTQSPRRAPALSDAQAEAMLAAADADPNLRTAAIIWLLLHTGIRVAELLAANIGDLGQDRGVTILNVRGKGGKVRQVEVEPYTYSRIIDYLATRTDVDRRPALPGQVTPGDRPLFATNTGRRMAHRSDVRNLIRRIARRAGLPPELADALTPHATRATNITAQIEAGVPIRDIQRNAGHASPVTTELYDRSQWSPDRSGARAVARRFHAARVDAARNTDQSAPSEETS